MAIPSQEEFEKLVQFFHGLDELIQKDPWEVDAADWLRQNFPSVENSWQRVLLAGKTAIDNACDPNLDYLDWKPEIKIALEAFQDLEPTEVW
jgi:hypothetical protein